MPIFLFFAFLIFTPGLAFTMATVGGHPVIGFGMIGVWGLAITAIFAGIFGAYS